jgi:hypothetical protein
LHEETTDERHTDVEVKHTLISVADDVDVPFLHVAPQLVAHVLYLLQGTIVEEVVATPSRFALIWGLFVNQPNVSGQAGGNEKSHVLFMNSL